MSGARLVRSAREVQPAQPFPVTVDAFGNRCWRINADGDSLTLRYDAVFTVPEAPDETNPDAGGAAVRDLPDDTLQFLLPSRYCPSDWLLVEAWQLVRRLAGWPRRGSGRLRLGTSAGGILVRRLRAWHDRM